MQKRIFSILPPLNSILDYHTLYQSKRFQNIQMIK